MSIQPLHWDSISSLIPKPVSELDQVLIDRIREIVEKQLSTLENVLNLLSPVEYEEVKWQYSASSQNSDLPDSQDALESNEGDFSEKIYALVHYMEERIDAEILLDFAEKSESFFPHLPETLQQIDKNASLAKQAGNVRIFFSAKRFEEVTDPHLTNQTYKTAPKNSPAKQEELAELKTVPHPLRVPIKALDLRCHNLTRLPPELFLNVNLPQVDLSDNAIEDIPPEIEKVNFMSLLNLHQNHLSSLPITIHKLSRLKTLDLSHNSFEEFPQKLHLLYELTTLDLSHNRITEIPKEFLNILQLQFLVLSHNQIERLPDKLHKLDSLQMLNLSDNPLRGLPHAFFLMHSLNLYFEPYSFCSPKVRPDDAFVLPRDFRRRNLRVIPSNDGILNFEKLLENDMKQDIESITRSMQNITPVIDFLQEVKKQKKANDLEDEESLYFPYTEQQVSRALLLYLPFLSPEERELFAGSLERMWLAPHGMRDHDTLLFHGEENEADIEALESLEVPPHIYSSIFNFIELIHSKKEMLLTSKE